MSIPKDVSANKLPAPTQIMVVILLVTPENVDILSSNRADVSGVNKAPPLTIVEVK